MAGFREFLTGEVLSAANVNSFLMKQSVMVFADAAARTTALGAEVAEGMLTYNEDTGQLEVFDGSAFVAARAAGIGSNVVSTTLTSVFTASVASGASTAVTGLTATITPTSTSSKILVLASVSLGGPLGSGVSCILKRDATAIGVGDADGVRSRVTTGFAADFTAPNTVANASMSNLDSPNTTDPVIYSLDVLNNASATQTVQVNRFVEGGGNVVRVSRAASSITVIEVAA